MTESKNADVAEWQTRLFKGQVRKSESSTLSIRTTKKRLNFESFFILDFQDPTRCYLLNILL